MGTKVMAGPGQQEELSMDDPLDEIEPSAFELLACLAARGARIDRCTVETGTAARALANAARYGLNPVTGPVISDLSTIPVEDLNDLSIADETGPGVNREVIFDVIEEETVDVDAEADHTSAGAVQAGSSRGVAKTCDEAVPYLGESSSAKKSELECDLPGADDFKFFLEKLESAFDVAAAMFEDSAGQDAEMVILEEGMRYFDFLAGEDELDLENESTNASANGGSNDEDGVSDGSGEFDLDADDDIDTKLHSPSAIASFLQDFVPLERNKKNLPRTRTGTGTSSLAPLSHELKVLAHKRIHLFAKLAYKELVQMEGNVVCKVCRAESEFWCCYGVSYCSAECAAQDQCGKRHLNWKIPKRLVPLSYQKVLIDQKRKTAYAEAAARAAANNDQPLKVPQLGRVVRDF